MDGTVLCFIDFWGVLTVRGIISLICSFFRGVFKAWISEDIRSRIEIFLSPKFLVVESWVAEIFTWLSFSAMTR